MFQSEFPVFDFKGIPNHNNERLIDLLMNKKIKYIFLNMFYFSGS